MALTKCTPRDARTDLYEIMRNSASFEEKARQALEIAREYLGADGGYLTRIDMDIGRSEVLNSTDSPDGRFPPGLELDLETTYCRRNIEADEPLVLHDAPAQGWDDDPAFETHHLHCYHGTTLRVDGEPYGTVFFAAEAPREEFSLDEKMFVELVTRLLEKELERDLHKTELTRQATLVNVLSRVLRHNLRNKLSVVRARTRLMMDSNDVEQHGESSLQAIDDLIDMTQKARRLDGIVGGDSDRRETDIVALVEHIIDDTALEFPDASFSVEHEGPVRGAVKPSFGQALKELVENAAEHGGDAPTVTVTVERVSNAVQVQVADDGPGFGEQEQKALDSGVETPLIHGSGLGLWLVDWVTSEHDGDIRPETTDDGTIITISVPHSPRAETRQETTELQRARDQYQAAFEEAFDGMVIFDDDAHIVDANPKAANIYALDRDDLLGRSLEEFLPEELDFERRWDKFKQAGAERGTVTYISADGVERPVEYSATTDIVPGQHLFIFRDVSESKQRQRDLQRQRDMLRYTEQVASVGAVEVNPHTEEVRWTDGARHIHGVDDDYEPSVEDALEFYVPEDREEVQQKFEQCLETGEPYHGEYRIQTAQDETRWVEIHTVPVQDEDETVLVRGAVQDITKHRNRKRELRRYEQLVENLPAGVFRTTLDGEFVSMNETLCDIYGADSREQLRDAGAQAVYADRSDRERLLDRLKRTGKVEDKRLEVETLDGDRRTVRTAITLVAEDGTTYLDGIVTDVTDKRRIKEELKQVRTIAEALNDPIYVVDEVGRFAYVNEAFVELVGYSEETILGNTPGLIKDDNAVEQAEQQLGQLLSHEGPDTATFEVTIQTQGGGSVICEDHMGVLPYEGDSFEGSVGILRDITERERREQELRRERDRLDKFAGVVSHDLRNPLEVASTRLELAAEECESPHLADIESAHDRMERLIEDLLTFAHAGTESIDRNPVDLPELLEERWNRVETPDGTLVCETERTLQADRERLTQLVENLLVNALEHGGAGVTVRVGDCEGGFYIEDNGPGIPEEKRETVFETGYSPGRDGTGFGLSIVEQVTEAHGWDIRVTEGDAGGARFEITGVESTC